MILAPRDPSWTSDLQNHRMIKLCGLGCRVCGDLSQQRQDHRIPGGSAKETPSTARGHSLIAKDLQAGLRQV